MYELRIGMESYTDEVNNSELPNPKEHTNEVWSEALLWAALEYHVASLGILTTKWLANINQSESFHYNNHHIQPARAEQQARAEQARAETEMGNLNHEIQHAS